MGKEVASNDTFSAEADAVKATAKGAPVTRGAEQAAKVKGTLDPLVDPAGYGVIRESRPRFEEIVKGPLKGFWELTVGTPLSVEIRLDTTSSMGNNVDVAINVMRHVFGFYSRVAPGYDVQSSFSTFNDVSDEFVLCRTQFEMEAKKIVHQLSLMVPCRNGYDFPEDPHYGLFGGAYLVSAYVNRIGLKGYDFTITDAPARSHLDERQLVRIFGPDVFEKCAFNGHVINRHGLPSTAEVVQDLLKRAHAFVFIVGRNPETFEFWNKIYGNNRVIALPSMQLLPHVQAAVMGLTEGAIKLGSLSDYLKEIQVPKEYATDIARSLAKIPLGAQSVLPNHKKRPMKGSIFKSKTSLWPLTDKEIEKLSASAADSDKGEGEVSTEFWQ